MTDPSGQYNNPNDTVITTVSYQNGRLGLGLDVRWYEGGPVDKALVPGQISAQGVNIASVGDTTYANLSASYALDDDERLEVFGRINNVFNTWPPFPNLGAGIFDEVGRAYRLGVRFRY